ncbi:MAG TPA: DUF1501 domain-containing protein [Pirellulales bacterium]|nr:DUF1501 domain-containing protein [Pirellulales bacterium]
MTDQARGACLPYVSRRSMLQYGAAGLGALSSFWSNLNLASAAAGPAKSRPKSVILIFNCGAPSHLDLWDMKPQATDTVRGPYQPIATNVPGIEISELLPEMATRADKLAIVRTVHHKHGGHNSGMYWTTVGRPYRIDSTLINPSRSDYPCFGTLVNWLAQRDGYSGSLPPYVITPEPHCDSRAYITPGQYGSCLGAKFDPFVLNDDPNKANFKVPNMGLVEGVSRERLEERRTLLSQLDGRTIAASGIAEHNVYQAKALSLMATGEARDAFDLSREPTEVRERYGRHSWGQSHLLARRLVESGVRFVTTVNGPSITWDTHKDNFNQLKNRLVPPMQQAYAALLDDLSERGLLDSTLVLWMGDFGRTPAINKEAGRDHWPQCYSVVLAGGGIRGGQVIGESDKIGAVPRLHPVTPADIHATVFKALGYDSRAITYHTEDGRPTPLSEGQPISELL